MSTAEIPEEDLEGVIGPFALKEYTAAEDWDQPKIRQWAARMRDVSDEEFVSLCASVILDSARMMSFRGNHEGIHARASACHHEAKRRHTQAGHTEDCRGDTLYTTGFNNAFRSQGHTPSPPSPCTCGVDRPKEGGGRD